MSKALEEKPVPIPFYVLRGHSTEVQCLQFASLALRQQNGSPESFLISGDAQGFVIVWSMISRRAVAIWRAHKNAVLEINVWENKIMTHGRDNKLYLWEILDTEGMCSALPLPNCTTPDTKLDNYRPPFLLCALDVNSINFCQASICQNILCDRSTELLVAVPGLIGSEYIDIYSLPTTYRLATRIVAPPPSEGKLGNVMSLDLKYPLLAVGYENGGAALFRLDVSHVDRTTQRQDGKWHCIKQWHAHREAVLSVILNTEKNEMYSCGIDSRLVKYDLSVSIEGDAKSYEVFETRHSGQQSLRLRSDNKLIGTGGWDAYARIYTVSKMKQVAVLGTHNKSVNTIAFKDKIAGEDGIVALGSKDSKISLWKIF